MRPRRPEIWEFRLAVGALHVSFVVSSTFARTHALGLLSMVSDLTVILIIVSACNEVCDFDHFVRFRNHAS